MTCNIIKLVTIANFPTKLANNARKGSPYLSKCKDIDNLNKRTLYYQQLVKNVREIDNFNDSKNLMPNQKQVKVNHRREQYMKTIGKYTEPLILSTEWNNKTINIVNNVWEILYREHIIQSNHPFLVKENFNDEDWIYRGNYKEFEKKYDLPVLTKYLKKWMEETNFNFYPIFNTIKTLKHFNVTDFSATSVLLTDNRNIIAHSIKNNVSSIKNDIKKIEFFKKLKLDIEKGKNLQILFPAYDFESVFPYETSRAWWLDSMHKAVMETNDGMEFIKNLNGNVYNYFDSPIGKEISNHQLVDNCGHNGFTFSWCCNSLNYIYNYGWNLWVHKIHSGII